MKRTRLIAMVIALMVGGQTLRAERHRVKARVDANEIVRTVDARLFGINTAVWDAILDAPATVSALRELNLQMLRFGGFSDEYHWQTSTIGRGSDHTPSSF